MTTDCLRPTLATRAELPCGCVCYGLRPSGLWSSVDHRRCREGHACALGDNHDRNCPWRGDEDDGAV